MQKKKTKKESKIKPNAKRKDIKKTKEMPEVEIVASKKKNNKPINKPNKSNDNKRGKTGRASESYDDSKIQERIAKDKARILEELEKTGGIVTNAIAIVKVANSTFYAWYKADQEFARAVDHIQEAYDIIVEDKLKKLIDKDDGHSIRFYLSHRVAKYKPKVGFGQDPDAKPIELIIERYNPDTHGRHDND